MEVLLLIIRISFQCVIICVCSLCGICLGSGLGLRFQAALNKIMLSVKTYIGSVDFVTRVFILMLFICSEIAGCLFIADIRL